MKREWLWIISLCVLIAALNAWAQQTTTQSSQARSASAPVMQATGTFIDARGKQIGQATLTETPSGVLISIDVSGLPPGEHAFHLHQKGTCEAKDGFKSAGDHYAPQSKQHGFKAQGGPHAGDMPNQFVQDDGMLRAEVLNANVTLREGDTTVFDKDGTAIVIHASADDYRSQPSGNAGDRIACAVIEPGRGSGARR